MRRMLMLGVIFAAALGAQDELLTLDAVFRLKQNGLGDDVILTTIRTAKTMKIDTTAPGLIAMKNGGLSDAVIKAIQERQGSPALARADDSDVGRPPMTSGDVPAGLPAELGVHYRGEKGWVRLDQVAGKRQIQRKFLSRITGIGSLKFKSIYRGDHAGLEMRDGLPTFYIRTATPGQGAILRLDSKKKQREVEFMTVNSTEAQEVSGESAVPSSMKQIAPNLFLIEPRSRLAVGEYILTFTMGTSGYDFAVISR